MQPAVAWLEWNGVVYWARYRRACYEPRTAVSHLIESIWDRFPGSAHFMLRSRIFTTADPTELCRGMVIVCAKRMSRVAKIPEEISERMEMGSGAVDLSAVVHDAPVHLSSVSAGVSLLKAERDRSIECWLVSAEGRLLGWAVNTAGRNRTQHAEMNLLRTWWKREGRPLPVGSRVVTTLEPCPMCAGALWECAASREAFEVLYQHPDSGTVVRRSVLRNTPILRQCPISEHL
ncbi:MAG: hypothetical protein RIR26_1627 [Pseudomonadota bacterium]|jgi:tRNA(Arg) A34 adenosine deaminase TadA